MATDPQRPARLSDVRRFEAAGFRAWPATSVRYDGTWVIRLTAGHPAKRLNSVNLLDPGDINNLKERIAGAARRFEAYGRPITFRISPLAGKALSRHLDSEGWSVFSESLVMSLDLETVDFDEVMDQIPMKDLSRFVAAALKVNADDPAIRPGLSEIITAIQAEAGLFVNEREGKAVATAICVHDSDLAGLFEVATDAGERGKGYGRGVVLSALKWARLRGARSAWLQVEADNSAALHLYGKLGFRETYRYHYRRPPGVAA
ncbi:MAG: GNAT family N-acetyltransferase [Rhizobiaceae bacterium]